MATHAQKTKVGIFLVTCIVIIVVGIALISGFRHEPQTPYWVEFDESVLGLGKGGTVTYLGVPVGAVTDIYVTKQNRAHVEMLVTDSKVVLRHGVKAKLVVQSLATGVLVVALEGGDPTSHVLPPNSQIPAEESLFESVSAQIQDLLNAVTTLTHDFDQTVGMINEGLEGLEKGELTQVVRNADGLVVEGRVFLKDTGEAVGALKSTAEKGINEYARVAEEIRSLAKNANELMASIQGKVAAIEPGRIQDDFHDALAKVGQLAERLQQTAESLESLSSAVAHDTDNLEYSVRTGLESLTETLDAIRNLAEYLKQDPSALVRGRGTRTGE